MPGIDELLDIVAHLIHVNGTWNGTLSQVEAFEKLAIARAGLVGPDVKVVVEDVRDTVADLTKTVSDVEGK